MTVVLITGALTGIGRATAVAFANEGDQIVVSGRHGDTGAELVGELRSLAQRPSSSAPMFAMMTICAT
jgi:NAD(P)-dependent dehydrogenase (short-subunit alcohol dehydrogenase family)